MGTLSVRISSWCVRSVHASVPNAHAQCMHQFLTSMISMFWRDLFKFGIFTLMLSIRVRNWCVCSGASVPDAYAQHVLKGLHSVHALVPDAYAQCTHQFLTRMLSARISSWRVCSAYASVPDAHAQCMHQFLTRMLRVRKMNLWEIGKLMRMLSKRVRNRCAWSGCASVPDAHAQGAHQFLTRLLSVRYRSQHARKESIISIIFLVPKTAKIKKKSLETLTNGLKNNFFCPNSKKILL